MNKLKYLLLILSLFCVSILPTMASGPTGVLYYNNSASPTVGTAPITTGGTGIATTPTDGQLFIGQTSSNGYVLGTLTPGVGIGITNGSGSITINNQFTVTTKTNTSFTAAAGSFYPVTVSSADSTVTLPDATTCSGQSLVVFVKAVSGGHTIGSWTTIGGQTINGGAASSLANLSVTNTYYILVSDGTNWNTLGSEARCVDGSITITPVNGVPIFSVNASALTIDLTSGVTGTLPATHGGTGSSTNPTDGQLAIGQTSGSKYTPTSVTGDVTITNGGVTTIKTNVGLAGSPTTTTQSSGDNSTKISTTAFVTTAVNNAIAGVNPAVAVQVASAAKLPNSPAYNNGLSGIGAFITDGGQHVLVIDGYTALLNDRVLVKNEGDSGGLGASRNGVYTVTTLGVNGSAAWVLTRALDYDQPSDMNNTGAIPVVNGTANTDTSWVQTSQVTTVGSDAVTFTQFSLNPTTILTNPASLTSQVSGILPIANGGTNTNSLTQYYVLVGAGASSAVSLIAPNSTTGIPFISNGGSTNPGYGTAVVAGGGTGLATLTAHNLMVGNGTGTVNFIAPGTSGNIPVSNGTDFISQAPSPPTGLTLNNCRMYTVTGSPLADGSSSGDATIYFGPIPISGKYLTLDDGSGNLSQFAVSEISKSLASGFSSATIYDCYVYNSSGTLTIDTAAWSSNTPPTRGSDALGRLTKNGATNKLLVGCFYMISSTKTANWTGSRNISNYYNQIPVTLVAYDSTSSWTNASTTPASANGSTTEGVGRVSFLGNGINPCKPLVNYFALGSDSSGGYIGIGSDSTTTSSVGGQFTNYSATVTPGQQTVSVTYAPTSDFTGHHYYQRLEWCITGSVPVTIYGSAGAISTLGSGSAMSANISN